MRIILFCLLSITGATVAAEPIRPLTTEHWRGAPATELERETGIPATAIEGARDRARQADPYPSIPGRSSDRYEPPPPGVVDFPPARDH